MSRSFSVRYRDYAGQRGYAKSTVWLRHAFRPAGGSQTATKTVSASDRWQTNAYGVIILDNNSEGH